MSSVDAKENSITDLTSNIEERSKSDSVSLLYENLVTGLIVNVAAAATLAFGFLGNPQLFEKRVWFFSMLTIFVLRFFDFFNWHQHKQQNTIDPQKMLIRFRVGAYLTGIAWGIYTVYFFESMSLIEFATTVVIMASLAGGASSVLAADRVLVMTYAGLVLIPLSVRGALSDEAHHQLLSILGIVFSLVMAITSKKTAAFTKNAILTKNLNLDLVHRQTALLDKMESQNTEINEINQSLEKKVEKRTQDIFRLSNIDPLTGLSNRNAFSKNLNAQIESASFRVPQPNIAVLFIDLDGFKAINDAHGHVIGDKVLKLSAQRLLNLSDDNISVCRWGGDEFIVAVQNSNEEQAKTFANDIIKALSEAIVLTHHELYVGATIGISMFPEHSQNVDDLILLADTAMYEQKQKNKSNALVFTASMRESLIREQQLAEGLSLALKRHELYLVYQPIIDTSTNACAYFEALLRWDLNGKTIPPAEFIPIAEHHAYIHEIGNWVLNKACEQAASWDLGPTLGVSVNVSIVQIMHKDIVQQVDAALASSGLKPQHLFLEITESIFASNINQVIDVVEKLKALGVNVSVDDFGTGFSSLSILQSLAVDIVKIDRAFVSNFAAGGEAIIQATQHIANELDYAVTVEGVETEEQRQALEEMGVKYLQGYYFAKPMRPRELRLWHDSYCVTH